ncbi:MAG TPA: succinyl-diaminopimelate desuccinylase [Myxococcota bacterium]|jgi:succinyl-diaminopimelate desuccinylase|nr:succinyl-diaminopimelate desuccinylase [Myxococcota bacterium]
MTIDLTELTLALCRVPSVTGNEAAIAADVAARLAAVAPQATVVRHGNAVVARGSRRHGPPLVGLFGHLDTVPTGGDDNPPRVAGGRIHGLGASDMKSGLALMVRAFAELPLDGLPVDLVAVFYDREEGPYAENGLEPLLAADPALREVALGLCLECTDGRVQLGCVGSLHARVTFVGRRAHSARPWQGLNAIHKAGPFLQALAARPRREVRSGGLAFYETMQATLAQGGHARNAVPDRFAVNVNVRFAPGRTDADAEADVRALAAAAGADEVEVLDRSPSAEAFADEALVQRLVAVSGEAPEPKQAWTDVARLAQHGIRAVNFGPGEQAQAHQAGESISIAQLERTWSVLRRFLTGDA